MDLQNYLAPIKRSEDQGGVFLAGDVIVVVR